MKAKNLFYYALVFFVSNIVIASYLDVAADDSIDGKINKSTLSLSDCHVEHIASLAKCAQFDVPENWQEPKGKKISLHVAVIPPSGGQAVKTPLYVLAGGPGQSASSLGLAVEIALNRARRGREVVLLDQRGTGKSTPFSCTFNLDETTDGTLFAQQCLENTNNRPQFFASASFIKDLDTVRDALGHDKIVLWGGSYGTRAALLYARAYPQHVETMILDAVAAPATPFIDLSFKSASRALTKLTEDCQANTECNSAFPELGTTLQNIKQQLTNTPLDLGNNFPLVDADIFLNGLRNALYSAHNTSLVPFVIHEFANGNTAPWQAIGGSWTAIYDDISLGTMMSVLCAEELPRSSPASIRKAAEGGIFADVSLEFWFDACAAWPAADYPKGYEAVVQTDIPTLVFSGELDPVTPPAFGEAAMTGLSNALHVIAKHNGHISLASGCAPRLVAEFLEHKEPQALDVSCMEQTRQQPFALGLSGPAP